MVDGNLEETIIYEEIGQRNDKRRNKLGSQRLWEEEELRIMLQMPLYIVMNSLY